MNLHYPKLVSYGFIHALGVAVYTTLVSLLMSNGEKLFGKAAGFAGGVAVLLLFVLSATITGLLILGRPAYLYFNGAKAEAVRLLLYTVGWLAVITVIVFILLAVLR